jgi:hypothetical protein
VREKTNYECRGDGVRSVCASEKSTLFRLHQWGGEGGFLKGTEGQKQHQG